MKKLTQSEKERHVRTAYVALDAVDRLVGHGLGGEATERALEAIRDLINQIDAAPAPPRHRPAANA